MNTRLLMTMHVTLETHDGALISMSSFANHYFRTVPRF